jgi:fructose-bisphosphate aldolase class II
MPLVNISDMLHHAHQHRYAVGAFDVVSLDFIEGVMAAAESLRAPIILSLAESHFEVFDFELLMAAVERAAERSTVPVAIHLDHGSSLESAVRAINSGCTGVMVDASSLPLDENIARTREVVEMARGCGVPVEGELGYVPGVEGEDAARHPGELVYTTVEEAQRYVAETGVDFLAVSIGTVHGRMQGEPQLDFQRLADIDRALSEVPLVIHGGTGLGEEQFRRLIENGVAKINYYTALADAAGQRILLNGREHPTAGYTTQANGVADAVQNEAERCIELWGSADRADELLSECRPWQPVEHLIVFNVQGLDEAGVTRMMADGRRILGTIPGVRRVFTGAAVGNESSYRYSWLVRFCDEAVIDSYRDDPRHRDFADSRFRPCADGRISIDYKEIAHGSEKI